MALLALLAAFCGLTVMRAAIVHRRTGINPVKIQNEDSAFGTLHRVLKLSIAAWLFVGLASAFAPGVKPWLIPIPYVETPELHWAGAILAAIATLWIGIAQIHMSGSFRMGVDPSEKTELVRHGLFSISRNPIYVGVLTAVCGFFLMAPNALTFGLTVAAFVGIPVHVRLEEEYLLSRHGDAYRRYRSGVRRWLGTRVDGR